MCVCVFNISKKSEHPDSKMPSSAHKRKALRIKEAWNERAFKINENGISSVTGIKEYILQTSRDNTEKVKEIPVFEPMLQSQ